MDWEGYKALCDRPNVMSRWLLTETAALVSTELRQPLLAAMQQPPLPKPLDHQGGAETDMFELALDEFVDRILAAVESAAARGETTTQGRTLGGFASAWRELNADDV